MRAHTHGTSVGSVQVGDVAAHTQRLHACQAAKVLIINKVSVKVKHTCGRSDVPLRGTLRLGCSGSSRHQKGLARI